MKKKVQELVMIMIHVFQAWVLMPVLVSCFLGENLREGINKLLGFAQQWICSSSFLHL